MEGFEYRLEVRIATKMRHVDALSRYSLWSVGQMAESQKAECRRAESQNGWKVEWVKWPKQNSP